MRNSAPNTRSLLLGFAIIAPALSLALIHTNVLLALAPLFVSHMLLLYATLRANNQWWGPVVTSFRTQRDEVWLTIDDGPSPAHTVGMLDLLEQFDARATFFVIGAYAEKHPHLITEILARGHAVANHTFSHPSRTLWCAGPRRVAREIDLCAQTLRATPERPNLLFRSPVGMTGPFVHPALQQRGLRLVGWTVRGLDTMRRDAERVAHALDKRASRGAILLLHEGHHVERDPAFCLRCLEFTLQRLTARGFRCVIPTSDQLPTRADGR